MGQYRREHGELVALHGRADQVRAHLNWAAMVVMTRGMIRMHPAYSHLNDF